MTTPNIPTIRVLDNGTDSQKRIEALKKKLTPSHRRAFIALHREMQKIGAGRGGFPKAVLRKANTQAAYFGVPQTTFAELLGKSGGSVLPAMRKIGIPPSKVVHPISVAEFKTAFGPTFPKSGEVRVPLGKRLTAHKAPVRTAKLAPRRVAHKPVLSEMEMLSRLPDSCKGQVVVMLCVNGEPPVQMRVKTLQDAQRVGKVAAALLPA